MITPGTILDIGGVRYECVGLDSAGNAQCVPIAGSGLVTSTRQFYSPGGPADQPVPTSAPPSPEAAVDQREVMIERLRSNAAKWVEALLTAQYGGDPNALRIQRELAQTISEGDLAARLSKWLRYLRELTSQARGLEYERMINDYNAIASLEVLIGIDSNIFIARGFIPPDNAGLVQELIKARGVQRALFDAVLSEAGRRGLVAGLDLGRHTWLEQVLVSVVSGAKDLMDYGARKAKEVLPDVGFAAVGLALLAVVLLVGSRR